MFIVCIEKQLDVVLSASYGEESCALKKNCRGAINQSHETTTIKMVPRHRCRSFLVSKRGKELNRTMRNKSSCHHTSLRPHKIQLPIATLFIRPNDLNCQRVKATTTRYMYIFFCGCIFINTQLRNVLLAVIRSNQTRWRRLLLSCLSPISVD